MADPCILGISCMKNEGAFLLEWIAHHRAIGMSDFLIYSNDCEDGTDLMLDRLAAMGGLHHECNPGPWKRGPQWEALLRADKHPAQARADWTLVFDVDEFVNIHIGTGQFGDLITALPEADAIALTWRFFGNDGVVEFADLPVTEQFRRAAPTQMLWPWRASIFKTLLRNRGQYRKLGVHRPRGLKDRATPRWHDGSGNVLPPLYHKNRLFTPPDRECRRLVQLNHYALGSMENYVVKCDRGRANRDVGGFDLSYWVERNFCSETDVSIERTRLRREEIRQELLGDPVLGPLHAQAVAWRRARIDALLLEEAPRAMFGRLLLTPPTRPLSESDARRMLRLGQLAHRTQPDDEL
ncbi:glycosyltransferase family 2 protein [Thioclava sp. GXIMD2076]|uniref:glycosyltransferase family 2 protein n=1 Tax=Thioclava sp. GXIMD2076 TaxID=3131931 RepID=UPI0030D4998F